MVGRRQVPKHLYHRIKAIYYGFCDIIGFEALLRWRRGELPFYYLLPLFIVGISTGTMLEYYYRQNIEKEWDRMYSLLSNKTKDHFSNLENIHHKLGLLGYFCGVYPAIYFDKPFVVHGVITVVNVFELVRAFEKDRVIWRITIGNRIDADGAYRVCAFVLPAANKRPFGEDNALEIRYFLCDGLRKRGLNRNSVRILLERFPGYISILDRDGLTSPFQLACQFSSLDVVQYMVELDKNLLNSRDDRGNTPLHWVCRNTTSGSLKIVNYLLEKQVLLVTLANKDGDLPIHIASDRMNNCYHRWKFRKAQHVEIVWRLLQAYPDCLDCFKGGV